MTGFIVQRIQGGADDPVVHARQPTGPAFALFVHVQAQDLDEQHLGQLGQDTFATRARRASFGQRVTTLTMGGNPVSSMPASRVSHAR
ncbi:hypothetical protein D3C84_966500 [compost metagenome]